MNKKFQVNKTIKGYILKAENSPIFKIFNSAQDIQDFIEKNFPDAIVFWNLKEEEVNGNANS